MYGLDTLHECHYGGGATTDREDFLDSWWFFLGTTNEILQSNKGAHSAIGFMYTLLYFLLTPFGKMENFTLDQWLQVKNEAEQWTLKAKYPFIVFK